MQNLLERAASGTHWLRVAGIALVVLPATVGVAAATPPASSTFDTDLDGWTLEPVDGSVLSWMAAGGNPGGYAHFEDVGGGRGFIVAPPKFLGNWTNATSISWDLIMLVVGDGDTTIRDHEVRISGPGGEAVYTEPPGALTAWSTITAPLQQSQWLVVSGTWPAILASVQELSIAIEMVSNHTGSVLDQEGIDNVVVASGPVSIDSDTWSRIKSQYR